MKEDRKRLLEQVTEFAAEGKFGDTVRASKEEYRGLTPGVGVFLKCVDDYWRENERLDRELVQLRDLLCQLLIVCYRDSRRKDSRLANAFVMSLIADFPGIPESSLTTKWSDLVQAALAFKEVAAADNGLLAWQQTKELVRAYNEFLGGLFGYMILMWRVAHGKTPNPRVFACTYGDKVNQLRELTGGKDGPFYVFCRLAKPPLRNAISHGRIALDAEKQVVRYVDGKDIKIEFEMQLVEFAALAAAGSHLVMPYLAAIGAIVAMEQGGTVVRSVMPPVLVRLWEHDVERSGLYRCN